MKKLYYTPEECRQLGVEVINALIRKGEISQETESALYTALTLIDYQSPENPVDAIENAERIIEDADGQLGEILDEYRPQM